MKKTLKQVSIVLLALLLSVLLIACNGVEKTGVWEDATYTSNKEFGDGAKTIEVEVKAEEQSITFTIHTDAETLRDALDEHDLVGGTEGAFGLMIETVNGMTVKYEDGGYWWGVYSDGVATSTGVDGVVITDGAHYELVRTNTY